MKLKVFFYLGTIKVVILRIYKKKSKLALNSLAILLDPRLKNLAMTDRWYSKSLVNKSIAD